MTGIEMLALAGVIGYAIEQVLPFLPIKPNSSVQVLAALAKAAATLRRPK